MGVTGLETAFAALHTELVAARGARPGAARRAADGGRRAVRPADADARASARPPNICLVDLDAEWEVGEAGYESRSANCGFAGRTLHGRVLLTIAAGAVAYRERSFAIGIA